MIYKSAKTLRRAKKAFSLIELMIVIVIIGALTAIILPQFDVSEADAKDTGCDASNYGTLSQLSKFRSANGAYPTRMHTGLADSAGAALMGEDNGNAAIPSFTYNNMDPDDGNGSTIYTLAGDYITSLTSAGIINLAYGGFPDDDTDAEDFAVVAVKDGPSVVEITGNWYEAWTDADGDGVAEEGTLDTGTRAITINGVMLPVYQESDPYFALTDDNWATSADSTSAYSPSDTADGKVIVLFITPTAEWNYYYDADGMRYDSKIQLAQVGACPWLEGGADFRYYMAIFKIYADGSKARLIGTMCPEGGAIAP